MTRLRDMGVEPFLLSSSLIGVLSQRLVRTLDSNHRQSYVASASECDMLRVPRDEPPTIYRPMDNDPQGFRGRSGIYEMVTIDDHFRTMIHDGAGEHELEQYARTQGPSIRDDGRSKVLQGTTTLEEVLRVTRED